MANLTGYLLAQRYKISKQLGAGGMGEVWLATDTQLGREVAIKFILPHYSQNQVAREAFINEARMVAKLDHPYIIKIYDIGMESINHQITTYLVMQYAANGALSDKLEQGILPLAEANNIIQQVCRALDYAHHQPIIHMDIKPANILFDLHGYALVNDFGLARVLEKQTHVSLSGMAGTPAYMPPEQYLVGKAGPFSDVFAIGVMLYHMLTGQLPRREFDDQLEIYFDKPLAPSVQTVITKATLTSPKQRYQTVKALAVELEQAINRDVSKPPTTVAKEKRTYSGLMERLRQGAPKPDSQPPKPIIQPVPQIRKTKIEFDWVTIPAGEFIMGSNERDNEKPIHKVYLPEYQIARVPVTNEQWEVFLQDSGYNWINRNKSWGNGLPRGEKKHPVVYVSWNDAMAFCKWAGVCLPTEAEWEKAARGVDGRDYPWGNERDWHGKCNFGTGWGEEGDDPSGDFMPVGQYPEGASPYGCLDMAGNVWEWCLSEYKPYPYRFDDGRENVNSSNPRVMRGGSCYNHSTRCAERYCDYRNNDGGFTVGFRCLRLSSVKILGHELEQSVVVRVPKPIIQPVPQIRKTKIEFDWVTIPAGEFIMGSNEMDDEKPIHHVYLPEYQIARTPVTNEQWGVFLQDSGYNWAKRNELWKNGLPRGKEKHPVVYVNWHDSMAFCQWAGVRLPTEAEWEKAARGTDGRKWPWGNNEPTASLCNFNRNVSDTTPVGNYPSGKSPYGCLDMAGNVWEWCSSQYKAYPYESGDGREEAKATNIYETLRSVRGGGWDCDGNYTRTSTRYRHVMGFARPLLGIRYVH